MANIFPFTKKSLVGEDGEVWTNQIVTQTRSPLHFSNTDDSLNDTYATAVDENESQYLSVLESPVPHDNTSDEMHNITLSNQKLITEDSVGLDDETEHENNFTLTGSAEQQVVIFNVEGCDEIYGIQLAEDDEGNVHKYQFQFRKTDDGQLEAMPETVQLLPNEEEQEENVESTKELTDDTENQTIEEIFENPIYLEENIEQVESDNHLLLHETEENCEENENAVENIYEEEKEVSSDNVDNNSMMVFMKRELNGNKLQNGHLDEQMDDDDDDEDVDDGDDSEEDKETCRELEHINIKEELLLDKSEKYHENELESHENIVLENLNEDCVSEADSYNTEELHNENEETIITYQHFDAQNMEDYDDQDSHTIQIEKDQYDEVFIDENLEDDQEIEQDVLNETGNVLIVEKGPTTPEIGDYEIVEGLSDTVDGKIIEDASTYYQEPEVLYTEPELHTKEKSLQKTTNILKQPTNVNKTTGTKKKILYYTVSNADQKENLNSLSNPRSVLKNNLEKVANDENLKRIQREKLLERRYARSKEAIQAKMFHNFINRTTIPHAPVRQTRLPRKQEIKPVDTRRDEEIIVKEVMVSAKGFIESVSERLKSLDKLEITSIVELSDSDEDYTPKNGTKKKKKLKPINYASDNSDGSIIEIVQSDDEPESVKLIRGRPKKYVDDKLKRIRGRQSKSADEGSPQKKSRTEESSEVESDNGKKEITCPSCPKTFPSQNSLSTHIQHHNLENSLRSCKKITSAEYKYKCDKCKESFKNSVLLKRHICNNQQSKSKHACNVCSKSFKDVVLFNIHKKTHFKENLIKATNPVTVSPKKFLPRASSKAASPKKCVPRPSTRSFRAPVNPKPSFKCEECFRVCATQNLLFIHEKSHKKFVCSNCNMAFASKLLLDSHVRTKCVKKNETASVKDKRVSFKIKRSFVNSPRTLKKTVSRPSNVTSTNVKSKPNTNINKAMSTLNVPSTSNGNSALNASRLSRSVNRGLNASSMIRTLDVEVQCDSCPLTFNSLTAMFKHKVKDHGLSTPDKQVLAPAKKFLHKPLNVHGGIPAHAGLNKTLQDIRRQLLSFSSGPDESTKK